MSSPLTFRVVWTRTARERLRDLSNNAAPETRNNLVRIVRELDERLRQNPLQVGEVYRSRDEIDEHLAVHEFLAIDFAVDKVRHFVLVRVCRTLSGFGS